MPELRKTIKRELIDVLDETTDFASFGQFLPRESLEALDGVGVERQK